MKKMLSVLLAATALAVSAPSYAATVIDQSQTIVDGIYSGLGTGHPITSQSFKAGFANSVGGGIFVSGSSGFAQSGLVTLSLYNGVPGAGGQALATGSVAAVGGTWADAFWSPVSLVIGQTYWLSAKSDTNVGSSFGYNPYANGTAYYGANPINGTTYDLTFRTYANDAATPGAVPEPATWAMMLLGFGVMGFAMRRRSNVKTTVSYA